jgi:phage FluMu gp28-like protein
LKKASTALSDINKKAAIPLYEYQKNWILDSARFKIGLMSRQAGKSFSTSLEAVSDCFRKKTKWVFLSAGERQSKELMSAAANHVRAYNLAINAIETEFKAEDDTTYKQLELILPNGSKIVGLPANPHTARGHSAHVLLDEFAFHKDSRSIWTALFGTVTRGYKIRIISTPSGKQNKFYQLWVNAQKNGYSAHKITIYDAIKMGLSLTDENGSPIAPEDLKRALDDEDAWQQEYLCEFLDETTALLTYDMIQECEMDNCLWKHSYKKATKGEYYIGMDIGRKKDLSVIWILEDLGNKNYITREIFVMEKTLFRTQLEELLSRIQLLNPRKVCIDATGLGTMLAEEASLYFSSVEPVTFTAGAKEDMATRTRLVLEDKSIKIPIDHEVRNDLHSIRKIVTVAGNVRYDADRSESKGHADRFWALSLALLAANNTTSGQMTFCSSRQRESSKMLRGY